MAVSDSQPPSFGDAVARGLGRLGDTHGRDTRAEFWPYAGAVTGGWIVIGNLVMIPIFVIGLVRDSPGAGNGMTWTLLVVMAVLTVAILGLLAAAVTRRLHDRDVLGRWACIPALLLFSAFAIFGLIMRTFDHDPGPALILLGFSNNALYFAAVIVLLIQVALPGTPGDNRFGPASGALRDA